MTNPSLPTAAEYAALGRALKQLRRTAGLTQKEAAEIVGIRSTFVSLIERGERGMRWHTLLAMLRAYGADLRALAEELERVG
ncbi:MAG TPA: helix-turn-helix transcriptional regulator [Solirubrobacteraceae bacterium]|jgi:transcriptional regulator with XRE-family HTH domain|nr:helix-turn-helix transcriptional regulator [Solirubrobacteraceae bacterium]